ncbi:helix-turn-helix domain-containing protein [bacterium 210820-DFI.6.52]|nr:helix-turn-helix domain-containing protein [bacterium 210820-DFI.6.52]
MCLENRIRKIRIQRGLSLWELAAALDTTEDTLSRYKTCDMGSIEADKVLAAAKALGVSPLYLMGWEDRPNHIYRVDRGSKACNLSEKDIAFLIQFAAKTAKKK